jgi:hypothetical protein
MGKGRFLNQKLGKRMSRKAKLDKAWLESHRSKTALSDVRFPKKGASREGTLPP